MLLQKYLTQAYRFWSYLYIFISLNILQSFLQTKYYWWNQSHFIITSRSAHVGELFTFGHIHDQIAFAIVFANYLSHIYLLLRKNKELTSILQLINGIGKRSTSLHANQRTILSFCNISFPRLKFNKTMRHNCLASSSCKKSITQSNYTSGGNDKF